MLATPLRRPRTLVPTLMLAAVAVLPASTALGSPLSTATDDVGVCADETGVTVVVDATELGGNVTIACASDPATGTEALAQAGISETRDPSGYICAVGGLPDPCPTEFTGSYWSYWTAAPGGEWTAYAEGSDTAAPAAGTVEGWRYGDGTQPPAVAPAEVFPGTVTAEPDEQTAGDDAAAATGGTADGDEQADAADADAAQSEDAQDDGGDGMSLAVGAAVGVAVVGGLVALIVGLRRRSRDLAQD